MPHLNVHGTRPSHLIVIVLGVALLAATLLAASPPQKAEAGANFGYCGYWANGAWDASGDPSSVQFWSLTQRRYGGWEYCGGYVLARVYHDNSNNCGSIGNGVLIDQEADTVNEGGYVEVRPIVSKSSVDLDVCSGHTAHGDTVGKPIPGWS